eukprot:scaffold17213_cov57-Attheya_sp.AAC.1
MSSWSIVWCSSQCSVQAVAYVRLANQYDSKKSIARAKPSSRMQVRVVRSAAWCACGFHVSEDRKTDATMIFYERLRCQIQNNGKPHFDFHESALRRDDVGGAAIS